MSQKQLLIVDDEIHILNALKRALNGEDYSLHLFTRVKDALEVLNKEEIPVIISDLAMPQCSGVDFFHFVNRSRPHSIRILLTGEIDFNLVVRAITDGSIYKYICKPWNNSELKKIIREAFDLYDKNKSQKQHAYAFENSIEAMLVTDLEGVVLSSNLAYLLSSEYEKSELIGKKISVIDEKLEGEDFMNSLKEELNQSKRWFGEAFVKGKDSSKKVILSIVRDGSEMVYVFV